MRATDKHQGLTFQSYRRTRQLKEWVISGVARECLKGKLFINRRACAVRFERKRVFERMHRVNGVPCEQRRKFPSRQRRAACRNDVESKVKLKGAWFFRLPPMRAVSKTMANDAHEYDTDSSWNINSHN